jgi:hypothetical protein
MLTVRDWACWNAITAKVFPLRWNPSMQISVSSVGNSPLRRRKRRAGGPHRPTRVRSSQDGQRTAFRRGFDLTLRIAPP